MCEYAVDKDLALVMGIDSNAHSTLYGTKTNKRGEDFEDFILKNGLMVENVGVVPTFSAYRSRGAC